MQTLSQTVRAESLCGIMDIPQYMFGSIVKVYVEYDDIRREATLQQKREAYKRLQHFRRPNSLNMDYEKELMAARKETLSL